MPDLLNVFGKRWKFILTLTILAAIVGYLTTLFSPKKFMSMTTALPANSLVADKARIFNQNIEALYSDFGSPDELDRMEGTAQLDTIYIAASRELGLPGHYEMDPSGEGVFKAAMQLRKDSRINRSAYGELKVRVWDKDRNKAAEISNFLMSKIQEMHQRLQNESNIAVLAKLKADHGAKQQQFTQVSDTISGLGGSSAEVWQAKKTALLEQLVQYEKMIDQYQVAINTNPPVLLVVENGRAPLWPDKPKVMLTVLVCAFVAFAFAFLMALFVESRKR